MALTIEEIIKGKKGLTDFAGVQQGPTLPAPVQGPTLPVKPVVTPKPVAPTSTVPFQTPTTGQNQTTDSAGSAATGATSTVTPTQDATKYYDPTLDIYQDVVADAKKRSSTQFDEQQIRDNELRAMQAEIDAQNQLFASKLARAKAVGTNALGTGTAIQSRRGLIGSDFGEAQTANINASNEEIYSGIEAERLATISNIMSKARERADQSLKDYVNYLAKQSEAKSTGLKNSIAEILSSGIKLEEFTPQSLEELAKSYGTTVEKVKSAYKTAEAEKTAADKKATLDTQKLESDIRKNNLTTISEGQDLYEYDPKTGQTKKIASKAKTYAPKEGSTSGPMSTDQMDNIQNSVGSSLKYLQDNLNRAGSLGTNLSSWAPFATESSNFVNQVENVKNKLLLASGDDIKKLFGPQISNSDVYIMKTALTNLDPYKQTPQAFKDSLDEVIATKIGAQAFARAGGNTPAPQTYTVGQEVTVNGQNYRVINAQGDLEPI